MPPFHHIAYDNSCADWDGLCDHLRLSASAVASELCVRSRLELMHISPIENIQSSLTHLHVFQQLVLLPQFIEILFFCLYKQINSSESKVKFRQASNCWKRVLESVKLVYYISSKIWPWRLLNFEIVRYSAYQRVALITGRCLFQSQGNEQY